MTRGAGYELLEWDSDFFGCRIARIDPGKLTEEEMRALCANAQDEAIDCLTFLVDAEDRESIEAAETAGFQCTDVRVTRERSCVSAPDTFSKEIEPFREDDLAELKTIARSSHQSTRFYHDLHFSRDRCNDLYEEWISNACAGEAERVLVARAAGAAVGYLTCVVGDMEAGTIGLVAVAEAERGKGLGEKLIRASLTVFANRGLRVVRVVSQARNLQAARLYERLGFETTSIERWYHYWPIDEKSA